MNENTITITLDEYRDLIAKAERIATVVRMLANTKYVTMDDIKVVLDINEVKENENETV